MGLIDINVPDTVEPSSATVSEILVSRGEWVHPGDDVMTLTIGDKTITVPSPRAGIIMEVLVSRGDSVPKKSALIHLKDITGQRPDFFNAWRVFSQVNVNVALIGKIFGNKVKENIEISKTEDGKWTNACPIRMSYVLNRTGFPIQPDNKYGTVTARDGKWYMYRVSDMLLHLKDVFGSPDIEVNRVPVHDDFKDMKGILVVTGDGPNAKGHITLWNGLTCADICHFAGDDNGAFSPRKAALWILP